MKNQQQFNIPKREREDFISERSNTEVEKVNEEESNAVWESEREIKTVVITKERKREQPQGMEVLRVNTFSLREGISTHSIESVAYVTIGRMEKIKKD